MTTLTRLAILAVWLALPATVLATEGGSITTATDATLAAEKPSETRGTSTIQRFLVCDRNPDDNEDCGLFDTHQSGLGTPSRAVFFFHTNTGCTEGTETVEPKGTDTDDKTRAASLGPIGSTTILVSQQMVVQPVVNRYLFANILDADNDCTDIEVMLQLFYDKSED